MSLLTKASLVLTPNAVKESKVYSIIPSNGNGDLDFTRGTLASSTLNNVSGLIETVPYNLVLRSEEFNDSNWVKFTSTISPNSINSPNGTLTADTFSGDGQNAFRYLLQNGSSTSGITYTTSVFAKKGTNNFMQIIGPIGVYTSGLVFANFDLNNGVVGSLGAGTTSSITDFGNGWYRCTMTATATGTSALSSVIGFSLINSATSPRAEVNTLTTSIYLWGAQLVQGSIPKDYFFTTDRLNVPRLNYDSVGGCPSLLLEPQRTNLNSASNLSSWGSTPAITKTLNTTDLLSPDGSNNATKLVSTLITGDTSIVISVANGAVAFSFYGRVLSGSQTIQVSVRNNSGTIVSIFPILTTQWQRFTIINSNTSAGSSGAVWFYPNSISTIYIYGAQLEQGAYATSYIPTTTSATTRNQDSFVKTGIADLINSVEGVFFVEISALFNDTVNRRISLSDTTANNRIVISYIATANTIRILNQVAGNLTYDFSYVIPNSLNFTKIAFKYQQNNFKVFVNGVLVNASLTGLTNIANTLSTLSSNDPTANPFLGNIKQLQLYKTVLTDAECIALTQ